MMASDLPGDALTAFEFFAGGGLAGLGLEGFQVTFANDIDRAKASSWQANHAGAFHTGDVRDLTPEDLPGQPDLVWASSPCQDVSLAGTRGGLAARRSGTFWSFWQLMQALDREGRGPRAIVVENVVGLLTSGQGRDFPAICSALVQAGYRVGALEMDAALWLPQSRPRLFMVAFRDAEAPTGSHPAPPFHTPRLIAAHDRLPKPVRSAWAWWKVGPPSRPNLDIGALLEPDDAVQWLGPSDVGHLLELLAPLHRERLDAAQRSGERRVATGFRRVRTEGGVRVQRLELRFDGVAGCLRTPSGGSSRQYVLVCDDGRVRARRLTGREAARLMGLPDTYVLPKGETAALRLMGDAVAVPVVRTLTDALLRPALIRARIAA
ncbi:DNA cytosine methyltransferase [Brevundimonas variabilis]|uniref:DNA (cytosine-5-)-methyltransferase n=1 Tax=Brevundimonas variabilis TaxID=74312 RepID=A0A7W9CKP9_9CAUL|nr:DNA cytosine methyltransferase [Brevundimonas variabilis]MBB5747346.1 DNA (cytosine-5)-methyltransferase 1 [Brevundimonas variabilis]